MNYDPAEIARTLNLLFQPGDVAELRAPQAGEYGTVSGYFDDKNKLAQAAGQWSGKAPGIYATLNLVDRTLLARSFNRVRTRAKDTTADKNILRRRWLLLDFDPRRPSGVSSTEAQHDAALLIARRCYDFLIATGFPPNSLVLADSGNGGHILIRIDLPNDDAATRLMKRCLEAMALRYDDDKVSVDRTVFNAARISKIYGTLARKGDSTPDRPHRLARLLTVPEIVTPAPIAMLEKLAGPAPEEPKKEHTFESSSTKQFDLLRWIADHNLDVEGPSAWDDGEKWIFKICPWNADHTNRPAYIVRRANDASWLVKNTRQRWPRKRSSFLFGVVEWNRLLYL
jgi:hypothetical protein